MARLPIRVAAEWDPEASVWVATTEDINGLVLEAETLERLMERLPDILQELIELNHPELLAGRKEMPFEVHASRAGKVILTA
jgi:predicted RNase H-like HicB family nuclease